MSEGLIGQTVPPLERILVDNGSVDGSEQLAERLYPGWKLIKSSINEGFARAANKGIRASTQPYILLLNTDVILTPGYCQGLISSLEFHPRLGGVMGLLVRADGRTIDSMGISLDRFRRRPVDLETDRDIQAITIPEETFEIFGVNAAAALYRRSLFSSIHDEQGYFDEEYVSFFEDVDLCWRARKRGWTFACVPSVRAIHARGGSGGLAQNSIAVRAYTNRFRLYLVHERLADFLALLPLNIVVELYRLFIKPLFEPRLWQAIRLLVKSLPDILERRDRCSSRIKSAIVPGTIATNQVATSRHTDGGGTNHSILRTIIVNHNTRQLLEECLSSLSNPLPPNHSIVVVDNASRDGSPAMIKQLFPDVELIEFSENKGFACAVNAGIASRAARYYLLLNSDTRVPPHFTSDLIELIEQYPGVGILGPLIRNLDGSLQISWGKRPTLWNEFKQKRRHRFYRNRDPYMFQELERLYSKARSVDWVTGACLLIRKETIADIGLMDERFFLYFEDIDWCVRARSAGWIVLFTPELDLLHLGGSSAALTPLQAALHYRHSQRLFYKKHFSPIQQTGLRLFYLFRGKKTVDSRKFKK